MMYGEDLARNSRQETANKEEILYDRYAPMLLGISLRYCGNRQDAEDVLHDGFIKILKNLHTFRANSAGSFEGWMRRIIVNTALNFLRDHAHDRKSLEIDPILEHLPVETEDMQLWEELPDLISSGEIMQMICELPPGYRTVFNLYVFEELSHKQIAGRLNFSESTSKSQLSKARAFLRARIESVLQKQNAG